MMTFSTDKWVSMLPCCLLVLLCALGITWVIQYAVKKHTERKAMRCDVDFLRCKTKGFDAEFRGFNKRFRRIEEAVGMDLKDYNDRLHLIENKVDYLMEEHDKDAKPATEDPAKIVADQIAGAILTGIDKAVKGP